MFSSKFFGTLLNKVLSVFKRNGEMSTVGAIAGALPKQFCLSVVEHLKIKETRLSETTKNIFTFSSRFNISLLVFPWPLHRE